MGRLLYLLLSLLLVQKLALGQAVRGVTYDLKFYPGYQLFLDDGTASNPGAAFTNDPNTGLRRYGTDELALTAGGVDILRVSNTGGTIAGTWAGSPTWSGAHTFSGRNIHDEGADTRVVFKNSTASTGQVQAVSGDMRLVGLTGNGVSLWAAGASKLSVDAAGTAITALVPVTVSNTTPLVDATVTAATGSGGFQFYEGATRKGYLRYFASNYGVSALRNEIWANVDTGDGTTEFNVGVAGIDQSWAKFSSSAITASVPVTVNNATYTQKLAISNPVNSGTQSYPGIEVQEAGARRWLLFNYSDSALTGAGSVVGDDALNFANAAGASRFYFGQDGSFYASNGTAGIMQWTTAGAATIGPSLASSTVAHEVFGRESTLAASIPLFRLKTNNYSSTPTPDDISLNFIMDRSTSTAMIAAWDAGSVSRDVVLGGISGDLYARFSPGSAVLYDYTALGDNPGASSGQNPYIKIIKLSGNASALGAGSEMTIPHGQSQYRIIGISGYYWDQSANYQLPVSQGRVISGAGTCASIAEITSSNILLRNCSTTIAWTTSDVYELSLIVESI